MFIGGHGTRWGWISLVIRWTHTFEWCCGASQVQECGAEVDRTDNDGKSAAMHAREEAHEDTAAVLDRLCEGGGA